jgi:hypothetical protein
MHPVETVSGNILNSFHMDLAEKLGATWNQLQCKSGYLWYFRQQLALALHPNPVSNLHCKVERLTVSFQAEWCFLVQLITLSLWVILFVRIVLWGRGGKRRGVEVLQFASVPMFYTYLTLEVHSLQLVQLLIQRCSQVWSFHSVRIVLWCILELMCIVYPSANQHNLPFFGWILHHLVTPKNPVPIIHRIFVKKNAPKSLDLEGKKSYEITIYRQ